MIQRVEIMKRLKTVFFVFVLILINFTSVVAQGSGPSPPIIDKPPDEELPIDNHIMFLVVLAVVLGIIIIYRNRIKKASM